jgi:hypothetical protein
MARLRGALPAPRHVLAAAMPHQIVGETPAQFIRIPSRLSFWLNDVDGDCVTAEEAFVKACHKPEIFITDATVQSWAEARGVLNAAFLPDVLWMMHKHGFYQNGHFYDNGGPSSVDWTNKAVLENAIWTGPVKIGVAADQFENVVPAPPMNGWFATGFTKDWKEDHCTSLCGFGSFAWLAEQLGSTVPVELDGATSGLAMFTWSSIGIIDWPSMQAVTGEAWVRNPSTVVK